MSELLSAIEERLVLAVPATLCSIEISQPVYAAVIQYFGWDAYGDRTPDLRLPTCSRRAAILQSKGDTAPHHIWSHDEFDDDLEVIDTGISDPELGSLCKAWYEKSSPSTASIARLRACVQRAARRLNGSHDWIASIPVSDDFVVYPGDMAHAFEDPFTDLSSSVSDDRLDLFRRNGLLGVDPWWKLSSDVANIPEGG